MHSVKLCYIVTKFSKWTIYKFLTLLFANVESSPNNLSNYSPLFLQFMLVVFDADVCQSMSNSFYLLLLLVFFCQLSEYIACFLKSQCMFSSFCLFPHASLIWCEVLSGFAFTRNAQVWMQVIYKFKQHHVQI